MSQSTAPIFVGGCGRSGTTLIRVILDSHPHIACGPELRAGFAALRLWEEYNTTYTGALSEHLLTPGDINAMFARLITSLMDNYRKAQDKLRSAEKSPNNVFFFQHLHAIFPESPLIHVIRDGRDVVCSLLSMDWVDGRGQPIEYTRDAGKAAEFWVSAIRAGRLALSHPTMKNRYREVRYEDIINDPEPTLKGLFEFIGEPWDPAVLEFHRKDRYLGRHSSTDQVSKPIYKSAMARWQKDLSKADKDKVKQVAGETLIELGYTKNNAW